MLCKESNLHAIKVKDEYIAFDTEKFNLFYINELQYKIISVYDSYEISKLINLLSDTYSVEQIQRDLSILNNIINPEQISHKALNKRINQKEVEFNHKCILQAKNNCKTDEFTFIKKIWSRDLLQSHINNNEYKGYYLYVYLDEVDFKNKELKLIDLVPTLDKISSTYRIIIIQENLDIYSLYKNAIAYKLKNLDIILNEKNKNLMKRQEIEEFKMLILEDFYSHNEPRLAVIRDIIKLIGNKQKNVTEDFSAKNECWADNVCYNIFSSFNENICNLYKMIIECAIISFTELGKHKKEILLKILEEDLLRDFSNNELRVLNKQYFWRNNLEILKQQKKRKIELD